MARSHLLPSGILTLSLALMASASSAQEAPKGEDKPVDLPGMSIFVASKRLEIHGYVCLRRTKQLEVLACTPSGKTHESLLIVEPDPTHIQQGLLMLGMVPKPQVKTFGEIKTLQGQRLTMELEWTEKTRLILCRNCYDKTCKLHKDPVVCKLCASGERTEKGFWCENCQQGWRWEQMVTCRPCWFKTCKGHRRRDCPDCLAFKEGKTKKHCRIAIDHGDMACKACARLHVAGQGWCEACDRGFRGGVKVRRRVEDLIFNRHQNRSMARAGFVFTGSRQIRVPVPPDFDTTKEVFAAKNSGNVIVLYHDPDAILDTPLIEGGDDTAYLPYGDRLPPRMTPITIHLRPWRQGDDKPEPEKAEEKSPEQKPKKGS